MLRAVQTDHDDLLVLEIIYTGLLVLSALVIGWFAVLVVYKLFKGQR